MRTPNHTAFTEAQGLTELAGRRDWTERTPPFTLTPEQIAICHKQAPLGWLDACLEAMHQRHCYDHRPILGLANSLNNTGDLAFAADWERHRVRHMAEARAEWERVCGADRRLAA